MSVLAKLNFISFIPIQNNNAMAVRCPKLIAKTDQQIQIIVTKDYKSKQHKWITNEHSNQRKVEVIKRVKDWWTASLDGNI